MMSTSKVSTHLFDTAFVSTGQRPPSQLNRHCNALRIASRSTKKISQPDDKQSTTNGIEEVVYPPIVNNHHTTYNMNMDIISSPKSSSLLKSKSSSVKYINLPSAQASHHDSTPSFPSIVPSMSSSRCGVCCNPKQVTTKCSLRTCHAQLALAQSQNANKNSPRPPGFFQEKLSAVQPKLASKMPGTRHTFSI